MIFSFFLKRSFFLTVKCCQEYKRVFGNFLWDLPSAFVFMTPTSPQGGETEGKEHLGELAKCRVKNQTEILGSKFSTPF